MHVHQYTFAGDCTGDGPCDTSPLGNGKNWVTKADPVEGLGHYVRAIAHALIRKGMGEQEAIATAVNTVKRWQGGGSPAKGGPGHVTGETAGRAGGAVAHWEDIKARAHAKLAEEYPGLVDRVEADERTALQLHVGWDENFHSEADTHTDAYAQTMKRHLADTHGVSPSDTDCPICHGSGNDPRTPEGGVPSECPTCDGNGNLSPEERHHFEHAKMLVNKLLGMSEGDMHVPRFLPNLSIDADPGQTKVIPHASGVHMHPKADGGVASHNHSGGDMTHGHAADDPENDTDSPLLPVSPGTSWSTEDKGSSTGALRAASTARRLKGPEKPGTHGGSQKVGLQMSDMDADDRNDLSDGQFAAVWTDDKGEKQRKLPIADKAHAQNAMSRFNQTQGMPADVKKRAARKILSAARRFGIKVSDDNKLAASEVALLFSEAGYENFEVIETAEMLRIDLGDLIKAAWDPDHDRDDDSKPSTDTDHDFWDADGKPIAAAWKKAGKTPPAVKAAEKNGTDGTDDPDDDEDDDVSAAEPQLITLDFGEDFENLDFGEHRQPYLVTGDWNFPDSKIGQLHVGPEELQSVVRHFNENARGQDLPICDIDHIDPAFRGAAVGWVKGLEFREDPHPKTGGPWIEAILDLNPVGEQLKANDQFRYGSPTLLRNWPDPATGELYPLIAAGVDVRTRKVAMGEDGKPVTIDRSALAWTNKPKLKQLGRIAASEDGTEVIVLAMADGADKPSKTGAVSTKTKPKKPASAVTEPDADDLGNQVTPKKVEEHQHRIWHYSEETDPAKVARTLSFNDPVGKETPAVILSDIANTQRSAQHMDQDPTEVKAGEETPPNAASPPATASGDAPAAAAAAADAAGAAAEMKFSEVERRALTQRLEAAEEAVATAQAEAARANQRADLKELAEKQAVIVDRAGALLRTGRIDKVEHVALCEPEHIVFLAENPEKTEWMLKMLEERPASFRVPLAELGTGAQPNVTQVDAVRLAERTQEIIKLSGEGGKPMDAIAAARQAARELAPSVRAGVGR